MREDGSPATRRKGYYRRSVEREADRLGLTPEEYGVYKGSKGSLVKPINSARGLLLLATIIALGTLFVSAMAVLIFTSGERPSGEAWFGLVVSWVFAVWAWRYVYVEFRAKRLRERHGKTLKRD